jgi:hypothetical protein
VHTKSANVPEIWDAGLLLFIKHIICPPIQQHLIDAILLQIRTERDGYVINRSAVLSCVDFLLQLSEPGSPTIYKRDLEPAVLRESEAFYKSEGELLLQTCDAPEYLRRVSSYKAAKLHYQFDMFGRWKTVSTPSKLVLIITSPRILLSLYAISYGVTCSRHIYQRLSGCQTPG